MWQSRTERTINHAVYYRTRTFVEHLWCIGTAYVRKEQIQQNGEILEGWKLRWRWWSKFGEEQMISEFSFLPAERAPKRRRRRSGWPRRGTGRQVERKDSNTRQRILRFGFGLSDYLHSHQPNGPRPTNPLLKLKPQRDAAPDA